MSDGKFDILQGEVAKRFTKELTRNPVEYNRSVAAPEEWQELVISVETDDTAVLGGLTGYTHWQWLFVERLWVKEQARRKGLGAQLLARAEQTARERGCLGSWLDTFSFHGPCPTRGLEGQRLADHPQPMLGADREGVRL